MHGRGIDFFIHWSLFSEWYGVDHTDRDAMAQMSSGTPAGHFSEKTHGFHVQGFVTALDHLDMCDVAIGVDHETACDTSFDALLIGFCRIFPVFVDVIEERLVASGERWLFVNEVIFKNFPKSRLPVVGYSCGDPACLRECRGYAQNK